MRGKRTLIAKTQVDLVLVTARYNLGTGRLIFARGYARRGQVWTDIKLFDRARLVEALEQGQQMVTGLSASLVGDFEILSPVHLSPEGQLFVGENGATDGDDLGLSIM